MAYITVKDLEKRFGDTEISNLLDHNDFAAIEADAASLIDGYLATRYTLPLTTIPVIVQGWAADITRYKLWSDRAPEEVRKRYEDTLNQLAMVAKGTIGLAPGVDGSMAATGRGTFAGYAQERVFTNDTLRNF